LVANTVIFVHLALDDTNSGRARCLSHVGTEGVVLSDRHRLATRTKHVVAGQRVGRAAALVICSMDGAFYLFGCDADWQAITDTWHESVREAKAQAEFEYDVSAEEWTEAS